MADMDLNNQADAAATPSWREALSATLSEATDVTPEGAEGEGQPEAETEGVEEADAGDEPAGDSDADPAEESEGGDEAEGESEASPVMWDGKADTAPDEVKAYAQSVASEAVKKREAEMQRGVQKLLAERQEMVAYIQQIQAQQQPPQAQVNQNGMPQAPAHDAGPEAWDDYYDKRTAFLTQQTIAEMVRTGQLLTPQAVQPIQQQVSQAAAQAEQVSRLQYIARLPGCTDEIMQRMADIAKADENLYGLLSTDKGSETVFGIAKAQVEYEAKLKGVGAKAEENARRGASAGKNAIPRPGGMRKQSEPVSRPKESFRSVEERIQYEIAQAQKAG